MANTSIDVLREDPELGSALDPGRFEQARRAALAGVVELAAGTWNAADVADLARGGAGLLVTEGLLVRRVGREGRFGAELLAPGDLLRPWEHDGEDVTVPFDTSWRVLSPTRLAVLDVGWIRRMAPFPEVGAALMGRAMDRSRRLAVNMAVAQHPRLEVRLHILMWHLADRIGKVLPDGVHLSLPITHETLGNLVAARRPSVSAALAHLAERDLIRRSGDDWVLLGGPPDTLEALEGPEAVADV